MPRTPLSSISSNIDRRKELNPYTRGKIVGAHNAGMPQSQIAITYNVPESIIQSTISRDDQRITGQSKPRSGRLKINIDRDQRNIIRLARIDLKISYRDLIEKLGI